MTTPDRFDVAHAEATPTATAEQAAAASLELLEGDEIVEMSIKPSLWYIPIVSCNWGIATGVLAALVAVARRGAWSSTASATVLALILLAVIRVAVAALQWASRLYVLTNRRVMHFHGVLTVASEECSLKRVHDARPVVSWYQRAVQLGSIQITPAGDNPVPILWDHVARPLEIYEKLIRAIHKSQSGPNGR